MQEGQDTAADEELQPKMTFERRRHERLAEIKDTKRHNDEGHQNKTGDVMTKQDAQAKEGYTPEGRPDKNGQEAVHHQEEKREEATKREAQSNQGMEEAMA